MTSRKLTVEDIAADLGCSPKTVRAMCQDGDLRASKTRVGWRITEADYAAYLNRTSNRPRKTA